MATYHCKKCDRVLDESNFYSMKDKSRRPPEGKLDTCKKCITMHIQNDRPETFVPILELIDVPWLPPEWDSLVERYSANGKKLNSMSIIGRYLSKMKLSQWMKYNFADSENLMFERQKRAELEIANNKQRGSDVIKALAKGEIDEQTASELMEAINEVSTVAAPAPAPEYDIGTELTQEDIRYLTLKWGRLYKPEEWIKLEEFFTNMMNSFDIQTPAHVDYLNFICKTSLKMNQAIDIGDVEGFNKLSRTYDSLMKSAKFTAAQNKSENGEYVDSVGELVALCEADGFIPKYDISEPMDIVDKTLADFKGYTYKLVTEEMGLGDRIEEALQLMKLQEEEEGELDESDTFVDPETTDVLKDADYEDFYDTQEALAEKDKEIYGTS